MNSSDNFTIFFAKPSDEFNIKNLFWHWRRKDDFLRLGKCFGPLFSSFRHFFWQIMAKSKVELFFSRKIQCTGRVAYHPTFCIKKRIHLNKATFLCLFFQVILTASVKFQGRIHLCIILPSQSKPALTFLFCTL